ncbi:cytochrome P450 [Staphylotrichum tortipilum]|uniref:Cytochrome P450 n=1 Tax=Staphylotrichum tortipilum TaxID=2831512 RepID=A0AAN6RMM3_9PEZI|nr:cytochrome P450 [Staphylotrichum longicolle]
MHYLAYGFVGLVFWAIGSCVYNVYFHPLKAVPGPFLAKLSRWWLFTLEMRGNPHTEILELHQKYGPMLRISPNEVSFNDIEASGIIYGQTSKFEKSHYFYRAFEDQAPNLFTLRDRQHHAQDKRLISHAFSRANIVQHQASIWDKAGYLMGRLTKRVRENETIPLFPAFRCMTLDTISEFAFGRSTEALKLEDFESVIFDGIDKATGTVPFFQHFPILREALRWASYFKLTAVPNGFLALGEAADWAFQEMHATDTWTMFKNMISSAGKTSAELTKEHLISEAILMIVAGTDTTAAALAINLHQLLQQPELYRKLQEEVQTVMPRTDSKPAIQDLDALPLLEACVKEGLRISAPSRKIVSLSPWYYLQDETIFPNPKRYDPLRWMVDEDKKRLMMSYFHPFSRGTRQCIGQNLSWIEQKIVLSMFVRRFNPKDVLKKNITIREAITVAIDDPVEVRLDLVTD